MKLKTSLIRGSKATLRVVFLTSGANLGENYWRSRLNCSLLNVSVIVDDVVVRPTERDGLEVLLRLYCLFDMLTASGRTRTVLEVIKRGGCETLVEVTTL